MGCVPAGCHTYSRTYNPIRHCHPRYHSTLIITRYLNFITATTKNLALQRYTVERKRAQPNAETRNYLEHGVCHLLRTATLLSKILNKMQCLCEFTVAPGAPQHGLGTRGLGIQGSAKPGPNSSPGFSFNHVSSLNTPMLSCWSLCYRKSENDRQLHLVCS